VKEKRCLEVTPEPITIDPVYDVSTKCLIVEAEKLPIQQLIV
jgi:hypothetical protein